MKEYVAFIGLGSMGAPMAKNLLKAQIPLLVYNRTQEKAADLLNAGALPLKNLGETFEKAQIVITMLSNDEALLEVSRKLLKTIKEGCIHISMSTVSPETTEELVSLHEAKGAHFIAAPVFGRPDVADAGKLWICIAGDDSSKKKIKPLLVHLGQRIEDFGEDPKKANVVKLAGNYLILSAIESMGEAYSLAEKNGLDAKQLATFFSETLFTSPVYKTYGHLIASSSFEPAGFKMNLGLKDINLVKETAESSKVAMPIAFLLQDLMQEGVRNGHGDLDWSAITLFSKESVKSTEAR